MVLSNRLDKQVSACARSVPFRIAFALAVGCFPVSAEPEPLKIEFLPLAISAVAVTSPDQETLVSVYIGNVQATKTNWTDEKKTMVLVLQGEDKVTRLCFLKNPSPDQYQGSLWADRFDLEKTTALRAINSTETIDCRFEKWVTQIGDKVLPLALVLVSFREGIPPAGTPLVDSEGKIVGLILQPSGDGSAYAIPAQAVHRVQEDMRCHRKLVRGWVGIVLSTDSQIPRIMRVFAGSPADKAGIKENDILLKAGSYSTECYPDAVNALFYTRPGKATTFEILRKNERIACQITPIAQKPSQ